MAWDGAGNFTRSHDWTNDEAADIDILSSRMDEEDDNFATGIGACLTKNNETKPTAHFRPNASATYDLGASGTRWKDLYLSGSITATGGDAATVSGNSTLAATDFSAFPGVSTITATATVTLPAASTVTAGKGRIFYSTTTANVQIAPNGTDTLSGTNANFRLPAHEPLEVRSNGTDGWIFTRRPSYAVGQPIPLGATGVPNGVAGVAADGAAISRTTYAGLFAVISTNFGVGDGSTTFNVPDLRGRTLIGSGTGTLTEAVAEASWSAANNTATVVSNDAKWITGMSVVLTTTTTLPTGLSLATTYYIIRDSATTVKFATSLANALAGTAIDITDDGTGTHTLTHTLTARTLGEKLGEEGHALKIAEMPAHTHPHDNRTNAAGGGNAPFASDDSGGVTTGTTGSTGGSTAHNIMQPSLVMNYIIKT